MEHTLILNVLEGAVPDLYREVKASDIAYRDGKVYIEGKPYRVMFMGDSRNQFTGLGTDEYGAPFPQSRLRWFDGLQDRDEIIDWCWGDVMLVGEEATVC